MAVIQLRLASDRKVEVIIVDVSSGKFEDVMAAENCSLLYARDV